MKQAMYRARWFCALSLFLSVSLTVAMGTEVVGSGSSLYPFLKDGKWGYIDASGSWAIQPSFDRSSEIFTGDRVRVWKGNHWGYIDRKGSWTSPPRFTDPCVPPDPEGFEVVSTGKKEGILDPRGKLCLQVRYDEIVLFKNRAWVRSSGDLGLFGLDGHWIIKPSISWPDARAMPIPTEGGVSWFQRGDKWGLLSPEGKVLFQPQFVSHQLGRDEFEDWNHPQGFDFKNGRAWVIAGNDYWLITAGGKVLCKGPFVNIQEWSDNCWVFENKDAKEGVISGDGKIIIPADRFSEIDRPADSMCVVVEQTVHKTPDGKVTGVQSRTGYINEHGKVIVEPGTYEIPYAGPGYSDGLAPVWNNRPVPYRDRYAGYIDHSGAMVIPEQFFMTEPFSEGLGGFLERNPLGTGHGQDAGLWGYVDKAGKVTVPARFGWLTPFFRGRAWVCKANEYELRRASWAMIDASGRTLTDFAYVPPESSGPGSMFTYDRDVLEKTHWRGDLAVLSAGCLGLAAADGKVLVAPYFSTIGKFHDGVAVATRRWYVPAKGALDCSTALITHDGRILVEGLYNSISDFDQGTAWADRESREQSPALRSGYSLIDTSGHELCPPKYVAANRVGSPPFSACPKFYGDLAPVAASADRPPNQVSSREKSGNLDSWGYINRTGKVVAWYNDESNK